MTDSLLARVETRMLECAAPAQTGETPVCKAVLHHLAAGGSRVRATLSLHASTRLGLPDEDAITLAAICELLHNASLIHDDLLDRAPLRRGRPSIWSAFDDATAVCAGDLLLAGAFALVGELQHTESLAPALALIHRRTRDVILGQGAEQSSGSTSLDGYESLAVGKSASLLSLPFELSLLLSGHDDSLAAAQRVAQNFAVAYQMLDDLADYSEDVRNGSLNAVSIAFLMGSPDYPAACALVCSRAESLLQSSIEDAALLPQGCGAAMIVEAEKMLLALNAYREPMTCSVEHARDGG